MARPGGVLSAVCEVTLGLTWLVFAIDYGTRPVMTEIRWRWFYRDLLDLAIVVLPMLRQLRLMRFLTVLAILGRGTGTLLRGRVVIYTVGATALVVLIATRAVLDAERGAGGDVTTFGDAIRWAFVTTTTVGSGDFNRLTAAASPASVSLA
ncbi:hypothetical protein GCM10009775_04110 [Microbacterium aoyamense]|uniref:Potassium channel domain-containing protein n=1 Tax=Microbacterium aoyamense TaxID=344166 RepID=A0ABN2P7X6_9MICO|nr:ion channel [Microbacterium aoyamense]